MSDCNHESTKDNRHQNKNTPMKSDNIRTNTATPITETMNKIVDYGATYARDRREQDSDEPFNDFSM